jgi:hypothetical protein
MKDIPVPHFNPEHGGSILIRNVGIHGATAQKTNIEIHYWVLTR